MNLSQKLFIFFLNLLLAAAFYVDNINALHTDLSSDSANIIPVCLKKDNPSLFANDLYLDDIKNVEYYTPFYVETLRFLSNFTSGDYLQAQNILGFFNHLIHGLLWFLLFYNIRKDYWLALLMMLLTKGIIWPPGGELIGIGELWSIMPRTIYSALLPLPFLLYVYLEKFKLPIAALALGFILNFHPLSGIGGIIGYTFLYLFHLYFNHQQVKTVIKDIAIILFFCSIGMFPYILIYLTSVKADIVSNPDVYELAFNKRIPKKFSDPIVFIKQWHRPIFYFYLAGFSLFYFFDSSNGKKIFKMLLGVTLVIFLSANFSVYIEDFVNNVFNLSIRMSFQLIRFQKFILVVFQIATYLLLVEVCMRYKVNATKKIMLFSSFFALLMFANVYPINKLPLIGDDICKTTLPSILQFGNKEVSQNIKDFNLMLDYVKSNTDKDAVFYGSYYIRSSCQRSVVLDEKGASMIIEGNPEKFSQWYLDKTELKSLSQEAKILFLKSKRVTHILSEDNEWDFLIPVKIIGEAKLYKI